MEIKKTIPLTIVSKIFKSKFNHGGKRSVHQNYKTLMKESEEDTNKWKTIPCS
jgi:hypothetical protein